MKQSHRKPPKPVHWDCKRGSCRYCGEAIIENGKQNNRKHWHTSCVRIWNTMNNPKYASTLVSRRDKYTCQECGHHDRHGRFDVDHIKPLFEAKGDPTYWQAANLRLLCVECHKDKTRADMVRYRAAQAELKKKSEVNDEADQVDPQTRL